ncbi:MAG: Hemoglobin-like protein HbO, partial [uncultured Rubrobacteraceae bacterium]
DRGVHPLQHPRGPARGFRAGLRRGRCGSRRLRALPKLRGLPRCGGAGQLRGQDRMGFHRGPRAGLQEEPRVLGLLGVGPPILRGHRRDAPLRGDPCQERL